MTKKSTKRAILIVLISLSLVALVVVGLVFLLSGNTTTTGTKTANEKPTTLICTSTTAKHPKLQNTNNPTSEETKTTLAFSGNDLETAGLIYTLYYSEQKDVSGGEAMLHAEFNIGLSDSGISTEAFSSKFNIYDDRLIINLYADGDEINEKTALYFLINATESQLSTWAIKDYQKNYEQQGFSCKQN